MDTKLVLLYLLLDLLHVWALHLHRQVVHRWGQKVVPETQLKILVVHILQKVF